MQLKHDALKKGQPRPVRVNVVGEGDPQDDEPHDDSEWGEETEAKDWESGAEYDQIFTASMVDEQWVLFGDLVRDKSDFSKRLVYNNEAVELFLARQGLANEHWNKCWSCGKMDHWSKDCPTQDKSLPYAPKRLFFTKSGEPRMHGQRLGEEQPKRRFFDQGVNIARAAPRVQQAAASQYAKRATNMMRQGSQMQRGPDRNGDRRSAGPRF